MSNFFLFVLLCCGPAGTICSEPIRIACLGDGITSGKLASGDRRNNGSYPSQLQLLLGSAYEVTNYAVDGVGVLKRGYRPIWDHILAASEAQPDVVVVMLGTNDAINTGSPWPSREFTSDYISLIRVFQNLSSNPEVLVVQPPPCYQDGVYGGHNQTIINKLLPSILPQIARSSGLRPPIDIFGSFMAHCPQLVVSTCDLMGGVFHNDALHPNDEGYRLIAMSLATAILGSAPNASSLRALQPVAPIASNVPVLPCVAVALGLAGIVAAVLVVKAFRSSPKTARTCSPEDESSLLSMQENEF
eukprot:TRINITY_DN12396_c0_g1_i1.p1 TRINITY_DN12396_c0_g1~~TRINITY_DN12396_c0_g1_i1.p1  ORF type:complete len:319 (+),score=50.97 TRINITY_DN12396_c0_g1_i1:53-958(+)